MNQIAKTKLPNIKNIIIVASGKGGVGKSTVAAGLAMSLAMEGYATGLLDADIYGPSVPTLFNLKGEKPSVFEKNGKQYMEPFVKFGIKLMSIGFFIDNKQAVIWRGPRVSSGITQLLTDTSWGELDYLIIDTPPGTGDIHITLLQNFETSGAIVVTTPQNMALADVKKAVDMYNDKFIGTPVLGIVENMAWFTPSQHPDEKYFLFGKDGGNVLSKEFNIPLLAQIPINEKLCEVCDNGALHELFDDIAIKTAFGQLLINITKN
ncbi:MAG TPA: Mrp/NBP35 family ATP-binding protein [Bacteroidales bacterium]|nr:Mrp/NBP35 family ATP-binding protein [Bacteroidales bacterium]